MGRGQQHIDAADVVINLAGRTVNCRYTEENLRQMMDSRVESTRIVGEAIARSTSPPKVWLQMSTATIYAHRFDAANDERDGIIGGDEPDAPAYWKRSIDIAQAWERELNEATTPDTRKVALRAAMVMSPDKDGVFDVLCGLTKRWLGGRIGSGKQYVSWIHEHDFVAAIRFLIENEFVHRSSQPCRSQSASAVGVSVSVAASVGCFGWIARHEMDGQNWCGGVADRYRIDSEKSASCSGPVVGIWFCVSLSELGSGGG